MKLRINPTLNEYYNTKIINKGGFMEYSKDIILGVNYTENKKGQAKTKKKIKHKIFIGICTLCLALIILDSVLVYKFITLLQTLI